MPGVRVAAPEFEPGKIVVLPYAVTKSRALPDVTGNDEAVKKEVRRRVAEACRNGQVYDGLTRQFRFAGERRRPMPFWQRFVVWGDCGFVIDVARAPQLAVVTVYVRLRD